MQKLQNKLTFSDLGITDDLAAAVSIENCYEFGSHFYIKDKTTLVICYEGVFFEAVKNNIRQAKKVFCLPFHLGGRNRFVYGAMDDA